MAQTQSAVGPPAWPDEATQAQADGLLRQFVRHTPAAVAMFDTQMRYILYSRRWLEDYGLGERDITGLSHYEVFPEIPERWKELHRRALEGEVLRCDEDPFPRADGRVDWVRWEIGPWHHPDGSIGGITMFTEVITRQVEARDKLRRQADDLERANAELRRTSENLRYINKASRVLASSLDPNTVLEDLAHLGVPVLGDWCMIYVSADGPSLRRAAVAYADPADAETARRLAAFPAPPLESLGPILARLRTGRPEVFQQVPDDVLARLATSPEHDEAIRALRPTSAIAVPIVVRGELAGIASFFSAGESRQYAEADIALADELGRRAAQAVENARLYTAAQRANAVKDRFIAMLSHELRNPLAPVLAGVALLRKRLPDDAQLRRTADVMERNVKLQARLISDLLDVSEIVRGAIEVHRSPVALEPVVDAAVQAHAAEAERAGVSLTARLEPGLCVLGDADRIQQMVMCLLSNALKFTPPGGRIRVSLSKAEVSAPAAGPLAAAPGGGLACIEVEDSGVGIAPELLPRLFDAFAQGNVGGQRAPGLGLGLTIVDHLARAHEGRVWAKSEGPGKGSRFVIEVPLLDPSQCPA